MVGLGDIVPAAVAFYLSAFISVVTADIFFADDLTEAIFQDFSDTDPFNNQLEELDMEGTNSIQNTGFLFHLSCIQAFITLVSALFLVSISCSRKL